VFSQGRKRSDVAFNVMGQDTGTRKGVSWAEEAPKTKNDEKDEEKGELRSRHSRWRAWRNWEWKKLRGTFSHIGLLLTLTGYTAAGGLVSSANRFTSNFTGFIFNI